MDEPSNLPKVLIVTVNPLSSTSNNGKTFASFFEGYPNERLAQLFFHREAPSSDVCDRYYRIGDEEYVRYLLRRTSTLGRPAHSRDAAETLVSMRVINTAKRSPAIRLLRSLVWTQLDFKAPGVAEWIAEFDPDVIFFCGGDANYLYRPVLDLTHRTSARLVYYITDDYVLRMSPSSWIERLKRVWTRRVFLRTVARSDLVLTIGDEMARVYAREFGVESETLMNLVDLPKQIAPRAELGSNPLTLAYVGGLHLNRWRVLLWVANGLERLSRSGVNARLCVYASSAPNEALRRLTQHPRIDYRGAVPSDEVPGILRSVDALLHVESSDAAARRATRLSVSTKIPEYLASGNCIVAVGPPEVASMRYLAEESAAFVVTTLMEEHLDPALKAALTDETARMDAVTKGISLARNNHDGARRRRWFHTLLASLDRTSRENGVQ